MAFRLENLGILFGLFALAIPLILHLLRRRHYDVLDWGAMQFLPDSITIERRRWLDEILLMLARMGLIALIVFALATPVSTSAWLAPLRDRSTRDIVLVFDGSYSMDLRTLTPNPSPRRRGENGSPWEEAVRWARMHLDEAASGDRFAIIIARQPPLFWQEDFSGDLDETLSKLEAMPVPRGNPDMPRALAEAWKHLQTRSQAAVKEIIVLTDQQKFGWADLGALAALENVGNAWRQDAEKAKEEGWAIPSLRVVKVGDPLPTALPNYALAPLTTSRGYVRVGQNVAFQSALHLEGFSKYIRPRQLSVMVDGKTVQALPVPEKIELKQGQIPLSFQHRFDQVGQHIVTILVEAEAGQDVLSADNEQHAVVEVVKELPVLLVDGEKALSPESSSFFLQRALTRAKGEKGLVSVPYTELKSTMIIPDGVIRRTGFPARPDGLGSPSYGDAFKPAVVVLADVPRLQPAQVDALDRFVSEGGGLLIVAGERVAREKAFYNEHLYRQGHGWLPAHLDEAGSSQDGIQLEPRTFQHPALEMLRAAPDGSMNQVRIGHWLKVQRGPKDQATPIAMLANGDPFLLEKPYKQGRVILCTIPLDRSGHSTLPNVGEFPILVNELVSYLAGGRNASTALRQGEPIRITSADAALRQVRLQTPEMAEKTLDVKEWPWIYPNTGAVGTYHVARSAGESWSFVVLPNLRESNLARCTEEDWSKIRERLPIVWQTEAETASTISPDASREELWWLLMLVVLGFLCVEVWMTRRMALARGA